jgi:hypothetical protein
MRTKHTYNCPYCKGEFQKDWLYRSDRDDDPPAMCQPCFGKQAEITEVVEHDGRQFGYLRNKITGGGKWIPVQVVKKH